MDLIPNQPPKSLSLLLSVLYGLFFSNLHTLLGLPFLSFIDRQNYYDYVLYSNSFLSNIFKLGFFAIFSDPAWLVQNNIFSQFFSPELTVCIFIFTSSSIFCYIILSFPSKRYFFKIPLLLFYPIVAKLFIVNIRQSFGAVAFLYFYLRSYQFVGFTKILSPVNVSLVLYSTLVHVSFLPQTIFYIFSKRFTVSRFSLNTIYLLFILLSFLVAFSSFGFMRILQMRQGSSLLEAHSFSNTYTFIFFWFSLLFLLVSTPSSFARRHLFAIFSIILYLITMYIHPLFGRLFQSVIFIPLLAILDLPKLNFILALCLICFYLCYFYFFQFPASFL